MINICLLITVDEGGRRLLLNVNPTRMELKRLKASTLTARRGHKLLKDKHDEMVKQFIVLSRQAKQLRLQVQSALGEIYGSFDAAQDAMGASAVGAALMWPGQSPELSVSDAKVMSVRIPKFELDYKSGDSYPYGPAFTSSRLDEAVDAMRRLAPVLVRLAESEKAVMLLASEIERTRRRVNALEYVLIPQQEETIKYISSRLAENERGNLAVS